MPADPFLDAGNGYAAAPVAELSAQSNGIFRHRRTPSGGGILSKLSFMRLHPDRESRSTGDDEDQEDENSKPIEAAEAPFAPISNSQQQTQKTRRRKGSLRKVALLGRGAQRERRENRPTSIDSRLSQELYDDQSAGVSQVERPSPDDLVGLGLSSMTTAEQHETTTSRSESIITSIPTLPTVEIEAPSSTSPLSPSSPVSPAMSYTTTDDEDVLQMGASAATIRPDAGPSIPAAGSDSFFNHMDSLQRRRSNTAKTKSPLSLGGLAAAPIPLSAAEGDWDYSETEWWGWVILVITWLVFVVGMGSCFEVWSWAWDVGSTPYAPPELENDPTLPMVGYYPALLILTGVMAWVWVVVAWVGMKYFRHAKISGD